MSRYAFKTLHNIIKQLYPFQHSFSDHIGPVARGDFDWSWYIVTSDVLYDVTDMKGYSF